MLTAYIFNLLVTDRSFLMIKFNLVKRSLDIEVVCMKSYVPIISLILFLCGQSYAQWERTNFPDTVKINSLVIIGSNIFAGTNGAGIFVSTDNGDTWNEKNEGLQSKIIHTIFINGTTIFAGTETGASVSINNGLSWNTINSGLPGLGVWSFAVSSNASGDTILFAGVWNGIYTSTDNGINWEATGLSNTTMPVNSIVTDKDLVIATSSFGGLFQSQDYGLTWKDISIIDNTTYIDKIIPVISLIKFSDQIIAGTIYGYFYHWNGMGDFYSYSSISKLTLTISSFAIRNDTWFAGDLNGYLYIYNSPLGWVPQSSVWLAHPIYSLALNDSYLFAGTNNGVWRLWYPDTTLSVNNFKEVPGGFVLEQNYPNPFNPVTTISYTLPVDEKVLIKVYDVLGKEVAELVNEFKTAGKHSIQFNGSNLSSGVYFYSIIAGSYHQTKKLILAK